MKRKIGGEREWIRRPCPVLQSKSKEHKRRHNISIFLISLTVFGPKTQTRKKCHSQPYSSNCLHYTPSSSPPPPQQPLSSMARPLSPNSPNPIPVSSIQSQSPHLSSQQSGLWGHCRAKSFAPPTIRPWRWRWRVWPLTQSTRGVLGRRRSTRLMTLITNSRLGTLFSSRKANPLARPRLFSPSLFPKGIPTPRMPWPKKLMEPSSLAFLWSLSSSCKLRVRFIILFLFVDWIGLYSWKKLKYINLFKFSVFWCAWIGIRSDNCLSVELYSFIF